MLYRKRFIGSLALTLLAASASAGPIAYVINSPNGVQQFGTMDLTSGVFTQIGTDTFVGENGLVPGPNGTLLSLAFSGDLNSIDPATGVTTVIGPTGMASCVVPSDPCGPTATNNLVELGGDIFATDLNNDLYSVNPFTGAATLIGPTGIPPTPPGVGTINPDGTLNAFDETLFTANGALYATFDAITVDFDPFGVTPVISPALYRIDPVTGVATLIAPTTITLGAVVNVNGTLYAFENSTSQVLTLDIATGNTTVVSDFDPGIGLIGGASPTPEPASMALGGIGIAAIALGKWRRRRP